MNAHLSAPQFQDADKAREYLEAQIWPDGRVCPHCGVIGDHYPLKGKTTRPGLYCCKDCRKPFTVTVGTLFERSKIPLNKWLMAVYLLSTSKKGISSHQLHRMLGVTYKTAWFMTHRIREAMADPIFTGKLGGGGGTVEADETYWGNNKPYGKGPTGGWHKMKVFSLVEREGNVRSFHVPRVNAKTLKPILAAQIDNSATLMTDDAKFYKKAGKEFAKHESVMHSRGEYVRGDAHTNTVEGFFSILKRGLIGTYHHVGEKHLQRYVKEFDFRYNQRERNVKIDGKWQKTGYSDAERTVTALKGIRGKRLMYKGPHQQQASV